MNKLCAIAIVSTLSLPCFAATIPSSVTLYLGDPKPFVVEWNDAPLDGKEVEPGVFTLPGGAFYGEGPEAAGLSILPFHNDDWLVKYAGWPEGRGMFDNGAFKITNSAGGLYSTSWPPASPAPVPEPAALGVLLAASLPLLLKRPHHARLRLR